ncbi:hypothetical protein [uncultured Thalassolituus sp.]|uniref:hypothetical protein n=1 Tax=uncultured Thalassolituus sp. TaxID=285273 RepID=UPI00261C949D|nr:hypothetical protein [uncultured Thalassolituus sp.]
MNKGNGLKTLVLAISLSVSGCAYLPAGGSDHGDIALNVDADQVRSKDVSKAIEAMNKGRLEKAGDYFSKALMSRFNSSSLQTLNAITYHLRALNGESALFELAEQGYLTAIRADRSNWEARFYLGLLYSDMQRFDEAKAQLGAYVLHDDTDVEGLYYLAYSSYYSGDVETAHAAAERLWDITATLENSPVATETVLRMLTIVKAAAGKDQEAANYFSDYLQRAGESRDSSSLRRRIEDWQNTYEKTEFILEDDSASSMAYENEFVDNQMVAVDVVIIRTEEDVSTARGVNLLSQLQFQFGNPFDGTPAYSRSNVRVNDRLDPLDERPAVDTSSGDVFDPRLNTNQQTITSFISIPAVTYNLNILNSKNGTNEILARPTLVARAGQTSEFFSGVEVSAAAVSGGAGDSISIEKEIGVKLSVTPEFAPDGSVILQVEAERTFLTTPSSSVLFEFRLDTTKTTVNANVALKYGQTLILGGLNERETEEDVDGVPILRDIPIINLFFSRRTQRDYKKSVMVLLTPRPASYMYSPPEHSGVVRNARDDAIRGQLQDRYDDWFQPLPNIRHVMNVLEKSEVYRNFQSGDLRGNAWVNSRNNSDRILRVLERDPV